MNEKIIAKELYRKILYAGTKKNTPEHIAKVCAIVAIKVITSHDNINWEQVITEIKLIKK
jgi:hypothetical protein